MVNATSTEELWQLIEQWSASVNASRAQFRTAIIDHQANRSDPRHVQKIVESAKNWRMAVGQLEHAAEEWARQKTTELAVFG